MVVGGSRHFGQSYTKYYPFSLLFECQGKFPATFRQLKVTVFKWPSTPPPPSSWRASNAVYDICRLQTADCRLHEAARLLIEWNQKYRNKGGVIINITLFREVRPRSEVYIFHANYTDLIPKGAVGCSFRIELEQNNVCRCHKLAHESIATV